MSARGRLGAVGVLSGGRRRDRDGRQAQHRNRWRSTGRAHRHAGGAARSPSRRRRPPPPLRVRRTRRRPGRRPPRCPRAPKGSPTVRAHTHTPSAAAVEHSGGDGERATTTTQDERIATAICSQPTTAKPTGSIQEPPRRAREPSPGGSGLHHPPGRPAGGPGRRHRALSPVPMPGAAVAGWSVGSCRIGWLVLIGWHGELLGVPSSHPA